MPPIEEERDEAVEEVGEAPAAGPMEAVKEAIQAEVNRCLADIDAGVYGTPEEAYDAVIAKMQALKEAGEPGLGGLGGEEGLVLPEEEQ